MNTAPSAAVTTKLKSVEIRTEDDDDDDDIWGGEVPGESPQSQPEAPEAPDLFADADVIHSYSRAQAIADGVLVDLCQGELGQLVQEAGFKFPLACTSAVFNECIALTKAADLAGNDIKGRLWDVLWMLKVAIQRSRDTSLVRFEVFVVRSSVRATRTALKAVCGPGDNMEPVITVMFPEED